MNSVDSFYKNTIVAKVDYSSWNFNSMELGIMARCNMADSSWELYDLPQLISMTPVTTLEKQERKQVFIFLLFFLKNSSGCLWHNQSFLKIYYEDYSVFDKCLVRVTVQCVPKWFTIPASGKHLLPVLMSGKFCKLMPLGGDRLLALLAVTPSSFSLFLFKFLLAVLWYSIGP